MAVKPVHSSFPADALRYLRNLVMMVDVDGMVTHVDGGYGYGAEVVGDALGRSIFSYIEPADGAMLAKHVVPGPAGSRLIAFPTPFPLTLIHPETKERLLFDVLATGVNDPTHGVGWVLSMTARTDISAGLVVAAGLYGRSTFDDACRAVVDRDTRTTPDERRTVLHAVVRPHSADRIIVTGDEGSHMALALGLLDLAVGERLWPADVRGTDNHVNHDDLPEHLQAALAGDGMTDCYLARIGDGPQAYAWLLWTIDDPRDTVSRDSDLMSRQDTVQLLTRAALSATTGHERNDATLIDPLTRLLNLAGLMAMATPVDLTRCALSVFGVDDMPELNTRLGISAGDDVLGAVAARLRSTVRSGDYIARISGSEFAILMPQTALAEAQGVALAQHAQATGSAHEPAVPHDITMTVSVATDAFATSLHDLLATTHGCTLDTAKSTKVRLLSPAND